MPRKLRVGVDARRFNFDGIGRITALIVEALTELADELEPIVLVNDGRPGLLTPAEQGITVRFPYGVVSGPAFERLPAVVREYDIDVMLGPQWYSISKLPCATIGFLHDAAPFDGSAPVPSFAEFVGAFGRPAVERLVKEISEFTEPNFLSNQPNGIVLYQAMYKAMLHRSHRVLTVSQASRAALARAAPEVRDKLVVCPPYVARSLAMANLPNVPIPLPSRYFLTVGKWEPRKRQLELLSAFERAARSDPTLHLVMIGDKFELYHEYSCRVESKVDELRSAGILTWIPAAPDEVLASAYKRATATIVYSSYEGFGIPIIESMHFGTAVVAAYGGAVEEVCGGACLVAEPEVDSLGRVLDDLWRRPDLVQQYRDVARLRRSFYSLERFKATLLSVVTDVFARAR